jgi:putative salt-induced outer membrane protein YdiY
MMRDWRSPGMIAMLVLAMGNLPVEAQEGSGEPEPGWSNSTEFSFVFTEGNSDTETLGVKNKLTRRFTKGQLKFDFDAVKSDTADDRFLQVAPGFTWGVTEDPPPEALDSTIVIEPEKDPDVEKYFLEGLYEGKLGKRLTWHSGLSWDRDEDAGILDRYIAFGGLGHVWYDREDFALRTTYGASYTDRDEETPDPEKEDRFTGARLGLHYLDKFGKTTTFESDFTGNLNVEDTNDYSLKLTNSIGVKMSDKLALKVSLQGLYESEPALEDVDVVAYVLLENGEFQTVGPDTPDALELEITEDEIRKEELDLVFRASLVVDF